jgi:serine O-acetyltransferase
MTWLQDFRVDVAHYQRYDGAGAYREFAMQQGLWALLHYRLAAAVYRGEILPRLREPLLVALYAVRKLVELSTGICLPCAARIGPGLYLNHFGPIIVNKRAVVGANCDISNGVTIGVSGRGEKRGVPVVGDGVYIGPNATVAGKITIGDGARISANSLVLDNVRAGATVRGVPAQEVTYDLGDAAS